MAAPVCSPREHLLLPNHVVPSARRFSLLGVIPLVTYSDNGLGGQGGRGRAKGPAAGPRWHGSSAVCLAGRQQTASKHASDVSYFLHSVYHSGSTVVLPVAAGCELPGLICPPRQLQAPSSFQALPDAGGCCLPAVPHRSPPSSLR